MQLHSVVRLGGSASGGDRIVCYNTPQFIVDFVVRRLASALIGKLDNHVLYPLAQLVRRSRCTCCIRDDGGV